MGLPKKFFKGSNESAGNSVREAQGKNPQLLEEALGQVP